MHALCHLLSFAVLVLLLLYCVYFLGKYYAPLKFGSKITKKQKKNYLPAQTNKTTTPINKNAYE